MNKHVFEPTKPLSTYLLALIAGPYVEFIDSFVDELVGNRQVPLGIYCRKTLAKFLQPDIQEIFTLTRQVTLSLLGKSLSCPFAIHLAHAFRASSGTRPF